MRGTKIGWGWGVGLGAILVAWLTPTPAAHAHHGGTRARDGNYEITLETTSGQRLRSFRSGADTFALGRYGHRYNVRISNHTGRRVEAVVSVDGRDVISGDVADFRGQRGYLVSAHGSVLIEGFRRSTSNVAAFRFTNPGNSYSSRRGTPQHVGVIGAAFFPERRRPRPMAVTPRRGQIETYGPEENAAQGRRSSRHARGGAKSAPGRMTEGRGADAADMEVQAPASARRKRSRSNLGTEYGETRYSPVHEVRFVRANRTRPRRVLSLRYDDRQGLLARGIEIDPPYISRPYYTEPRPFPASARFAPPPP